MMADSCRWACSAALRSLISTEMPMMATRWPSAKTGVSVTYTGKRVPSRRRTQRSPAEFSPRRRRSSIISASGGLGSEADQDPAGCPMASSLDQPYICSAALFQ